MLLFNDLSFWERSTYFEQIDFTIVGSGIVGLSAAFFIKQKYPDAKVLLIERGYLPTGASTKNAGFACFGSPSELKHDLTHIPEQQVWETFSNRYFGLETLFSIVSPEKCGFNNCASWDLIDNEKNKIELDFLEYLNLKAFEITGQENIYTADVEIIKQTGFKNIVSAYKNRLEGSVNTGKLIHELYKKVISIDVNVIFGIELMSYHTDEKTVELETNYGIIKSNNLVICTNGFAGKFLGEKIKPARAQVLITKPISNLNVKGTFHYDSGYYYFRNIENRILLGGGRNLDFQGETTENIDTTELIQNKLQFLLREIILPKINVEIDYSWAGIMGVGDSKTPIIEKTNKNVAFGVRMGGMGVAIGSEVGKKLSNLF